MGLFCSKTSGRLPIPRVINKNSNTPKIPRLQVPPVSDGSKLDTKSTSSSGLTKNSPASLSRQQPKKGVIADIAQTATGVAIGNVVGRKITDMFGDKNNVKSTVESPTETDYSIDNELKNEEITGDGNNELDGQGYESTDHDHYDASEENYDDSE